MTHKSLMSRCTMISLFIGPLGISFETAIPSVRRSYVSAVSVVQCCVSFRFNPLLTGSRNSSEEPEINKPIKMEVGIEECLHIEFEFNSSKFHLKDCILGKVFFNLVRIKIKHMELSIIKKEIVGRYGGYL